MRRLTPRETIELREQLEDICRRYGLVIANDSDDPAARAREIALSELRVASLLEMFSKAHVSEAAPRGCRKGCHDWRYRQHDRCQQAVWLGALEEYHSTP